MEKEKATKRKQQEMMMLQAAYDGNLRLFKKMARVLDSGQGAAALLAAVEEPSSGNRALHIAAMRGWVDICRYLIEDLRLHVDQLNDRGDTPLFVSAFFGAAATTRYLLDHGADPTVLGKSGTPLHGAATKGQCEVLELLLSRGTNVDLDSVHGSPLHMAALHKQAGTMKISLNHHADPSKVYNLDDTPLGKAINPLPTESLKCVKLLIKAGADVNFIKSDGGTYLMMAADNGSPGIVKCLLDAGANPNIPDELGNTAIEIAAFRGRREIVEMLFPFTSPFSTLPDWSIDGILSHVKSCGLKQMDKLQRGKKRSELKLQATDAFKRKEYMIALELYGKAMGLDPSADDHATLLANRSLCSLCLGSGNLALSDATMCRMLRPHWPKAYYRQGAALMLLKDYEKAWKTYAEGLKLDPTNVEIAKALGEAMEAMENAEK